MKSAIVSPIKTPTSIAVSNNSSVKTAKQNRRRSIVLETLDDEKMKHLSEPDKEDLREVDALLLHEETSLEVKRERRKSIDNAFGVKRIRRRRTALAKTIHDFINSKECGTFLCVITIIALFAFDFNNAVLPKSCDTAVLSIIMVCFAVFLLELALSSYANVGYAGSFFWVLDVVGTLSMIPDMLQIIDGMGNGNGSGNLEVAKAGKAGRIARSAGSLRITRYAKIFRIVRLVRVVRILRIIVDRGAKRRGNNDTRLNGVAEAEPYDEPQRPSKIGKLLSDRITKRIIVLVILLISVLPQLEHSETGGYVEVEDVLLSLQYHYNSTLFETSVSEILLRKTNLIYARVNGFGFKDDYMELLKLRETEKWTFCLPSCNSQSILEDYNTVVVYSILKDTRIQAWLQMALCVFSPCSRLNRFTRYFN